MKKKKIILHGIQMLALFLSSGCGQIHQFRDLSDIDCTPPVFASFSQNSPDSISFEFNEPIKAGKTELNITPADFPYTWEISENTLTIQFDSPAESGKAYALEASVSDYSGNSLYMIYPFYGYNTELPEMLINEFTTQGSSSHPDLVELKAVTSGNLAGMALFEGTAGSFEDYLIFPPCKVQAGDFILVHFKPEGIPEELDEADAMDISGGRDSSDTARDFWVKNGNGLGGNNGAVCLFSNPGGKITDAVLYSNRTSSSDTNYDGFGSTKFKLQAETVYALDEWTSETDHIRPEDCINPDDSTSTRSICRNPDATDSNGKTDWYIVDTGEYSFGKENSTVIYEK